MQAEILSVQSVAIYQAGKQYQYSPPSAEQGVERGKESHDGGNPLLASFLQFTSLNSSTRKARQDTQVDVWVIEQSRPTSSAGWRCGVIKGHLTTTVPCTVRPGLIVISAPKLFFVYLEEPDLGGVEALEMENQALELQWARSSILLPECHAHIPQYTSSLL